MIIMGKWTGTQSEFMLWRGKVYWRATRSAQHLPVGMYVWKRGTYVIFILFTILILSLHLAIQGFKTLAQLGSSP